MPKLSDDLFERLDTEAASTPGEPVTRGALEALRDAGMFGLMVPKAVGGQELPLDEVVEAYEEVSRADGSIGWVHFAADLTTTYFGAYLPDSGVEDLFAHGVPFMAGQFAPNGVATAEGDNWVVDGDYQFGSGIHIADFGGAGILATPTDGGDVEYLFACFPVGEAELVGNWNVLGLRETASYDYHLRGVSIPSDHTFEFLSPTIHRGGGRYALGVLPLTAMGHAGWALGVTRRALDELSIAAQRTRMGGATPLGESEHFLIEYGRLESQYLAGRTWILQVCRDAEAETEANGFASVETQTLMRQACVHVNRGGADIAAKAYELAGTAALRDGPLQRCFRDLHAGSQHFFASPASTVDFARTLLR